MNRSPGRVALAGALALVGLLGLAAPAAHAKTITAHTNRDGSCRLHSTASRTGTVIDYAIRVNNCSTRFGVRYVMSRGLLYDTTEGVLFAEGEMAAKKSRLPHTNRRRVSGTDSQHAYRTRIDVSIVLRAQRNSSTRRPERWRDPGRGCRVKTTWHEGDTLGCVLSDRLPA